MTFYQRKHLATRNTYVKYESFITYPSKVIANVKVFCRQTEKQTGHKLNASDLMMLEQRNETMIFVSNW